MLQERFEEYMTAAHGSNFLRECTIQQIKQKREAFFAGAVVGANLSRDYPDEFLQEVVDYAIQIRQRL